MSVTAAGKEVAVSFSCLPNVNKNTNEIRTLPLNTVCSALKRCGNEGWGSVPAIIHDTVIVEFLQEIFT